MISKPKLLLDTCALVHLDELTLGSRTLVELIIEAFDLCIPPEVHLEFQRHVKRLNLKHLVKRQMIGWRKKSSLQPSLLEILLKDLPDTSDWYPHSNFFPVNRTHLFPTQGQRNSGERELILLHIELYYLGHVPILLSDDLKAIRLVLKDLIPHKINSTPTWTTLDLVIYLILTGLKRPVGKKIVPRFTLKQAQGTIRDLVLKITAQKELQQQILTHYHELAGMIFDYADSETQFDQLELKYAKSRYR